MNIKKECDLDSCLFCQSCSEEWLELTAIKRKTLFFKKGEQIFSEGQAVEGIFFMISGAVKIHKKGKDQRETIIRFARSNDVIGIRGFGDDTFRVSATALEPVCTCFIPAGHLEASLLTNPKLSHKLMQVYAEQLHYAEQRMADLAHMDVKGRIAAALLMLSSTFGEDQEGFIQATISRQDIASYSGTIYETLFKIFNEWAQAEVLATEGKRIKILKYKQLESFLSKNNWS